MMEPNMTPQRKRPGKPPGKLSILQKQQQQQQLQEQQMQSSPSLSPEAANSSRGEEIYPTSAMHQTTDLESTACSTSPALSAPSDNAVTAIAAVTTVNAECRRSSRKKIIKFDVRDLLNKNRKPHKIQIEARIDSNAPAAISSPPTSQCAVGAVSSAATFSSTPTTADLTSKQKNFIEKSAIFRRYSISAEQQNKMASAQRLPMPPASKLNQNKISLLSKLGSEDSDESTAAEVDRAKMAQARRLSRTQEIFNASMMKSKQNSSLIIAQMESNSSTTRTQAKAKSAVASATRFVGDQIAKQVPADKRVERVEKPTPQAALPKVQKRRGRPPKNKAKDALIALAAENRTEAEPKTANSGINRQTIEENQVHKASESNEPGIPKTVVLTPEKATNWREYKACLRVSETKPKSKPVLPVDSVQQSTVILEISSSSSESDIESSDAFRLSPNDNGSTKQRNFASVSFLQEVSSSFNDNVTATEFIVAAVEEIVTEQMTEDSSCINVSTCSLSNEPVVESLYDSTVRRTSDEKISNEVVLSSSTSVVDGSQTAQRIAPSSSSSESEASSDRSQTTKAYKAGDKLRVSLKRLSPQELSSPSKSSNNMPPTSPATSVCSSSRSALSSSPGDVFSDSPLTFKAEPLNTTRTKRKYVKKHCKRMQKVELKQELRALTSATNRRRANIEKTKAMAGESEVNLEDNEDEKLIKLPQSVKELEDVKESLDNDNNDDEYNTKQEPTEIITVQQDDNIQEIILVELDELEKGEELTAINRDSNDPRIAKEQEKENLRDEDNNDLHTIKELEEKEGGMEPREKAYIEIKTLENERETREIQKDYDEIRELRKELQFEGQNDEVNSEEKENEMVTKEVIAEELITEDLITEELTTEELTIEELITGELTTEKLTTEELTTEELITEELTTEELITEELTTEELTTEELVTEELTTEELTTEELTTEELKIPDELKETLNEELIEKENLIHTENESKENVDNLITSTDLQVRGELVENNKLNAQNENEEIEMKYHPVHNELEKLSQADTIEVSIPTLSSTDTIITILSATKGQHQSVAPQIDVSLDSNNTTSPELAETQLALATVTNFSKEVEEQGVDSLHSEIIPYVANEEIVEAEELIPSEALDASVSAEEIEAKHHLDPNAYLVGNKTTIELLPKFKESIKLPPKKQLQKYILLNDAVKSTEPASPKLHTLVNQITDQVNVETKTLLDILKAVQSNESAAVATSKSPPPGAEVLKDYEGDSSQTRPAGGTSSPQALIVKKTTSVRRYERRGRRIGEEDSAHKTLEETFAEIAAQSSKEILEMFTNRKETTSSNSSLGSEAEKANKVFVVGSKEVFDEELGKNASVVEREKAKEDVTSATTEEAAQDFSEQQQMLDSKIELGDSAGVAEVRLSESLSEQRCAATQPKKDATEEDAAPKEVNQRGTISAQSSIPELEKDAVIESMTERKSTPTKRGRKPKARSKEILPTVSESKSADNIAITDQIVSTKEAIMRESFHIRKSENESVIGASEIIRNQERELSPEKTNEAKNTETSEGSLVFQKTYSPSKVCEEKEHDERQKTHEDSNITGQIESVSQKNLELSGNVTASNDVQDAGSAAAADEKVFAKETERTSIENEQETGKVESFENKEYQTSRNHSGVMPPATEIVQPAETQIPSLENVQIDTVDDESNAAKMAKEKSEKIAISPPKKRFLKTQMLVGAEDRSAEQNKNDITPEANSCRKKAKKASRKSGGGSSSKDENSGLEKTANATASKRGPKGSKKLTPESKTDSTVSQSQTSNKKSSKKAAAVKSNRSPEPKTCEKKQKKSEKKFLEGDNNTEHKLVATAEKSVKKKRQKKLQEAFEAALTEVPPSPSPTPTVTPDKDEQLPHELSTPPENKLSLDKAILVQPESPPQQSPLPLNNPPETVNDSDATKASADAATTVPTKTESSQPSAITAVSSTTEPEEDPPDPLKDIEKFIEDGVNLLKRGYKIDDNDDDDSVDGSIHNAAKKLIKEDLARTPLKECQTPPLEQRSNLDALTAFVDTPADTPLATPTVTPPPKSPIGLETSSLPTSEDSYTTSGGVRRSHRIKQNSKAPKALVGRGLVRDKERLSLKDDVETKSHYTIDDHRMDLAEVEAKNAKFLKDMEERLSNFRVIKENEYKCERVVSKEAKKMICDCFLTAEEEERGELGCGEDCLNRLLMIECGPDCNVKERCTNKRFQLFLSSPCRVFRTEKKGFGIMADVEILQGEFIMEYVGEVINGDEFERRRIVYSLDKNRHYYFMALRSDAIIDATNKGNISRFINHSCEPNAETQKWTVNGELRIGFFSKRSIMPGEEITFDYQYQRYGREAQRCYCESANCRGWIGEEPNSDEGEQVDDDSDGDEEEEENLAESLLADDDDEDSDETDDAEEAQKKLEIAAAEAKLMPITEQDKSKLESVLPTGDKKKKSDADSSSLDGKRGSVEEDSKSKLKKLLSKMAEKVAKRKKQKERRRRKGARPEDAAGNAGNRKLLKARYLEDRDIEDEVNFLSRCGLKNQSDTLRFSRLMVRAKIVQTRLNLLKILRDGELPCRRLFLDYHGLRLLHGWMSEDGGNLDIRLAMLEALETLPVTNKTVLTDSKVYQAVRSWCSNGTTAAMGSDGGSVGNSLSPSDESSKESTNSQPKPAIVLPPQEVPSELKNLALKLTTTWDSLPEIFRIPKRERIEQMKEHEREADRQYADAATRDEEEMRSNTSSSERYHRDRFGRGGASNTAHRPAWSRGGNGGKEVRNISVLGAISNSDPRRRGTGGSENIMNSSNESTKHLSKEQRREMFAAKVARDEAEKRLAEERREFETKCRFFGLDPKKTRPHNLPFCVNPNTGQWYSADKQPIPTPPSYAHVQVPVKALSANPADYRLPASTANLPHKWKYAITAQGKIYYYHVQHRIPQWEPPTHAQIYGGNAAAAQAGATVASDSGSDGEANDSSDDDYEIIKDMDAAKLKAYVEQKIGLRRVQRYNKLVDERSISPRREEDRLYNQIEVRKYKENKEKIRKRKEEIRRRRLESLKNATLNMCTLGGLDDATGVGVAEAKQTIKTETDEPEALPIQDYLLSSDDEVEAMQSAECNTSPLLDKIVQGDKIVDELDALTTKRPLKRTLPPHGEINAGAATSNGKNESATAASAATTSTAGEKPEHHKKRKVDKRESSKSGKKSRDQDSKYRKMKEKFRCEIAGIIVHHLKPYRKDGCIIGRIQSNDDFNHLARKLTHFVMIKELKYCESVGQTLVVTESVKNKSREFIKKYMAKYGDVYVKPDNDPDFKDIPFTL